VKKSIWRDPAGTRQRHQAKPDATPKVISLPHVIARHHALPRPAPSRTASTPTKAVA